MPKPGSHRAGVPCWVVLGTPDPARAQAFYGALFDWEFVPTGPGEAVATRYGVHVAAVERARPADPPAAWTTFLACPDLPRTAAAVRAAGGRLARDPYEVAEQGRAAIAVDPLGVRFGLWRAGTIDGAGLVDEPGAFAWNEHLSSDPDAARVFYRRVFGYGYDRPRAGHTLARVAGLPACSIGPAAPGAGARWLTHFATESADRAVDRLRELGGTVVAGPAPAPFGRTALVRDDAGAEFVLVAVPARGSTAAA